MGNKGHSERDIFGRVNHYDEHGNKIGFSDPDIFGGYTNYDSLGNKTGRSEPTILGGYNHYDKNGRKIGHSNPDILGGYSHYDRAGKKTGRSSPSLPGYYKNEGGGDGCYIATCVYGSYDCPQVWTLRRYRDSTLGRSFFGRCFIRTYYRLSPRIVSLRGHSESFRCFWKKHLDRFVDELNKRGVENTPYKDKNWRE